MSVFQELFVADFQQCFEQMRHYDETFHRTLQFGFGGVVAVIAASAALAGQSLRSLAGMSMRFEISTLHSPQAVFLTRQAFIPTPGFPEFSTLSAATVFNSTFCRAAIPSWLPVGLWHCLYLAP
jgi:hypothetical protein